MTATLPNPFAEMATLRTKFIEFDARRDPKTDFFCVACQKDMDRAKPVRAVHMVDGGYHALHPADEADCGAFCS